MFFGRFIALLRILAGPLAGAPRLPYPRFLVTNVCGGIVWAGGTTASVYLLGVAAEVWVRRFSWAGLAVAVIAGLIVGYLVKRRTGQMAEQFAEDRADPEPEPGPG